jgi:hypothetical protein
MVNRADQDRRARSARRRRWEEPSWTLEMGVRARVGGSSAAGLFADVQAELDAAAIDKAKADQDADLEM